MRDRNLRIGLLSPWASRAGGGVFEAVVTQAAMIADAGATPVVFALADPHSDADRHRFNGAEVNLGRIVGPSQIGYSPELGTKLAAANLDLLHLHGIWLATSHLAARWAGATGRPYIISPHGMLDPWITARGRLKKGVARLGYERRSWGRATLFHALTEAEASDIRRETGRDAISVIPNAIPGAFSITPDPVRAGGIIYLGRIHKKKNIDALIDAWCQLAALRGATTPPLNIAGWGDEADVAALRGRVAAINDTRLGFVGPVFGDAKRRLIENAEVLALPSHSEGLPMVILEAWAGGVPTAMSCHCNLPEGFATGAAVDCGTDAVSIAKALAQLLDENDTTRLARRDAARKLVARNFAPEVVSGTWMATYEAQLANKGEAK